jgi:catechol 2,3-dioxygenase-like lactoylglutathione lyase family enzyme
MPIGTMHHVGIAVRRLEDAEAFVTTAVGLPVVKRLDSAELGLRMVFLDCGPVLVELIEFADPELVRQRLGDRTAVIDHIALEVPDLDHAREVLAGHDVNTIHDVPMTTPLGRTHFTRPDTSAGVIWQLLQPAVRGAAPGASGGS